MSRTVDIGLPLVLFLALPVVARAQTDEIQVYDAAIAAPGILNLTLHSNFTPAGLSVPAFPGAVVSNRSFNGVPEWAYGISRWLEAGVYLPLYTIGDTGTGTRAMLDGAKLRVLLASPRAGQRRFFYAANLEFSYNARHWESTRFASELRPIIGWRVNRFEVILNPILDTSYTGIGNVEFAPAARVACNLSPTSALALEEYASFGPLSRLLPQGRQGHQIYAVFDHAAGGLAIEAGVGFGLTGASDKITLKLMFSRDLN